MPKSGTKCSSFHGSRYFDTLSTRSIGTTSTGNDISLAAANCRMLYTLSRPLAFPQKNLILTTLVRATEVLHSQAEC
jgi:hypothetical protein